LAKLKEIWIENESGLKKYIRIDWDNDRHQRVEIKGDSPESVAMALKEAGSLINSERVRGAI